MSARNTFTVWNGPTAALTAAVPSVTTGTAIKTMMQIKPVYNISIIEWGFMFDIIPTALVAVELVTTGTVAATVTSFAAGDVVSWGDTAPAAAPLTITANTSGYTSAGEGTVTTSRLLDFEPAGAQSYRIQFPQGREPTVFAADICRIRMTTTVALNARCFMRFEA